MAVTEYLTRIDARGPHVTPDGRLSPYVQQILNDFIAQQNANAAALNGDIETLNGEVTTVAGTEVLVSAASAAFGAERVVIDSATISWDFGTDGEASASLVATAAGLALLDDADASAQRATLGLGTLATLNAVTDAYTVTNAATDRAFDADAASGSISASPTQAEVENIRDAVLELADVLGTLISDLQANSVVG